MTRTDETATGTNRPPTGRSRTLLWILGGTVVVALVIGIAVGGLRQPTMLDSATPEGVVQAYLSAVFDHDYQQAVDHLTQESATRCTTSDFRASAVDDDIVVDLDEVRVRDDRVEVRVQMRATAEPLPFEAVDTWTETFVLIDEGGAWRITGDPWPLTSCTRPE
jgi:hypothetical protein